MAGNSRRWWILGLGVAAQAASCVFIYGLPYLLPELRRAFGLSLGTASLLITCPMLGVVLALIAWGAVADRYGERMVIAAGLVIAAAALSAAATVRGVVSLGVLLAVAGMGGASVNAASGRLVLGWFSARERGLAMGTRQTAQPLGTMLAAAILPAVALGAGRKESASGVGAALGVCAGLCLLTGLAVAVFASDPPRPQKSAAGARAHSPYRAPVLWRIHGASTLLVVPQFVVTGFALEYLVSQRGWALLAASRAIAAANLAGALTRLAAGKWSDLVNSRLRPMRQLAVVIAVVLGLAALGAWWRSPLGEMALLASAALTVSTNGLAFTAVAEIAGMSWAGRALGVQNTAQNIAAAATPPVMAQLIQGGGYPLSFGITALFPVVAAITIPGGAVTRPEDDASATGAPVPAERPVR
jgi:sugar phosphate permease